MKQSQSGIFTTFYYFALIAWTIASLGLAGQLRNDLRTGELVLIFSSMALTASGWILPVVQLKNPEMPHLNRVLFFLPFFWSTLLIGALLLAVIFGAAYLG